MDIFSIFFPEVNNGNFHFSQNKGVYKVPVEIVSVLKFILFKLIRDFRNNISQYPDYN